MRFELNEIEARREQYPSTISFLNLINALIAEESDLSDRGRRYCIHCVFQIWVNFIFMFFSWSCTWCLKTICFSDLLESLGSSMIMFLDHFLKEPMQILVKSGSWLVPALNIFTCEWFCFLVSRNNWNISLLFIWYGCIDCWIYWFLLLSYLSCIETPT